MTEKERFEAAIDEAITLCMDRGLHPVEMVEVFKRKAAELEKTPS